MSADTIGYVIWGVVCLVNLPVYIICGLKGKPWMVVMGVFIAPTHWFGAIRLAKPGSWWYRNRYDNAKQVAAWERFYTAPAHIQAPKGAKIGGPMPDPRVQGETA